MIPVKLRVHNFLPYKGDATTLSFTSIHTACISGDNGAGKSSVIDAITWALWGKSRAKNDDDLIHQGENEAEVELHFSAGGQLYRVIRRHARPKSRRTSGQSSLELHLFSEDGFLAMTAERIHQTEDRIQSILHMDYDTFINSAYLRQGNADEFTKQEPAKRKEVLTNILGLEIYNNYEERAKENIKVAQQHKLQIAASISEIENKLIQKPTLEIELAQAEKYYQAIFTDISTIESKLKQLRYEEKQLVGLKARLEQLDTAIKRNTVDLQRKTEKYQTCQQRIMDYKALIEDRAEIEASYQRLQKATEQCEEMNQLMRQIVRLREECKPYEVKCNEYKNALHSECIIIEGNIQECEKKAVQIPELHSEQLELTQKRQALMQTESELASCRQSLHDLEAMLSHLYDAIKHAQQDIKEIENRQSLLTKSEAKTVCPLCESDLNDGQLELVNNKYSSAKAFKLHAIDENNKAAAELTTQLKTERASLSLKEDLFKKEISVLARQEERISQSLREAAEAQERIKSGRTKLAILSQRLAAQDYAHTEREALAHIEATIAALSYNETRHDELQKEKQLLHGSEKRKHELDEAVIRLQHEIENTSIYTSEIAMLQTQQIQDEQIHQQLTQQLTAWPELQQTLLQTENYFQQQTKEHQVTHGKVTVIKEKLAQLTDMEAHITERRNELALITEKESLFKQLAQVFGKKGIQAMLIESALPEIETEANNLLGRMTNGRMTLTFETQQATKKGNISETLDIRIADELGTRDYEMFSGGEGFRIDFAVRIALSRLLARRAGAPLPTLIIDEGFGTQDTDGIGKLKEAINSIQDDFQKILVITHIDELKETFPVRINVAKTAEGSRIEIN